MNKKEISLSAGVFLSAASIGLYNGYKTTVGENFDKSVSSDITVSGDLHRQEIIDQARGDMVNYQPLLASISRFSAPSKVFIGVEAGQEFSDYWKSSLHFGELDPVPSVDFSSEKVGVIAIGRETVADEKVSHVNKVSSEFSAAIRVIGVTLDNEGILRILVAEYTGDDFFQYNSPGEIGVFTMPEGKNIHDISRIEIQEFLQSGTLNTIEEEYMLSLNKTKQRVRVVDVNIVKK